MRHPWPASAWRQCLLQCLVLLALASAASLALGLVIAHWLGIGGAEQAPALGLPGYCIATLDHSGVVTSVDCRLWLRFLAAARLGGIRVAGAVLWLREPLVVERGSLSLSFLHLGPGSLYASVRLTGLAGGAAHSLVEVAAASGTLTGPIRGVLVAEASGDTPLLAQGLGLGGWGYVVAETGGLCSPVIEAYSGLAPVARWSLVVETRGSAAPISVAVLVPGNVTGVRLSCIGGGHVPASLRIYRAPLLRVRLLDPRGDPVLDEEVPVLVRQVGVEALPPPWS